MGSTGPTMSYSITRPSEGIVLIAFSGEVGIKERFLALDDASSEAGKNEANASFLIDLSGADVMPYGISHALALSDSVARKRQPFAKVAYVVRVDQSDAVAAMLAHLHNPRFFRRFTDAVAAIAWLRDPHVEPLFAGAPGSTPEPGMSSDA